MLKRFRESLALPMSERYFDVDELIDVFDYAGDIGDDYLRIEVLMCAARYYSDNEELLERKAIFYSQMSEDMRNKYIDDNSKSSGLMWDIMRARRNEPQDEAEKARLLDNLINTYSNLNDEEVIQFIDLVSNFGQIQWLKDNLDKLRSKVGYLNILLYEVAVAADMNQDLRLSVSMLEELTELEPYNLYFWLMLAKEYASLDESEKALTSIDYALAINPDDIGSLMVKAKLLYTVKGASDEVIDHLRHVLEIDPSIIDAVRFLSSVYSEKGNKILARDTMLQYLAKYPAEGAALIPDLIIYRPANTADLLDTFYKSNEENSQIVWASWAHQLAQNGFSDLADEVLAAYHRNSGSKIITLFPIETHFMHQRFDNVIDGLSEYLDNDENTEVDFPSMVIMHLMSMIKIGEFEKSLSFCRFLEANCDITRFQSVGTRLEYIGLMKIVRQIKNKLCKTFDPDDWADYDPLKLW